MNFLKNFLKDEQGQDLIEYTLLLAFVALAAAALFTNIGASITSIWTSANTTIGTAPGATAAS
jgi:Flp pilus assembly pilin Flp